MKWVALESKMLSAAAFDEAKQELYLRFRHTGQVYRYFEFTAAENRAFLTAESKGRFSALGSATTSVASAWPSFTPPDCLP